MKKMYLVIATLLLMFQFSYAQTFEIRARHGVDEEIIVEMRETSGSGTPTTGNSVTDIVFGLKWLQSLGTNLDLTSSITTSYNIIKSGGRSTSGSYYFQAFGANSTPFSFPSNWVQNTWVEIMSITNNLQGDPGTGTFEICETSFDGTTDPNIGVDLTDYTPTINGSATNVPTPVELSSFTASVNLNVVSLKWQTQTEVDNYGFEIERLQNYKNAKLQDSNLKWEKIGFVAGNGNSNSPKNYSFIDKNFSGGSKFTYRLKQVDNDGTYSYSSEVEVEVVPDKYELYQNYPNPFNPVTIIKFSLPEDSRITINVYNLLGEKVTELVNADYEAGFHLVQFDTYSVASGLASGIYIYSIETKNFKAVKKMMLMK